MLEAWCHTDIRSHGDTEHSIFLKTIFNEENQGENLVNPRVTELLWILYSYIWSRDYVEYSNFLSHHNQSYHITDVSDRRIRSIICSCIHRKDEIKKERSGDIQNKQGVLYLLCSAISITFWCHQDSELFENFEPDSSVLISDSWNY